MGKLQSAYAYKAGERVIYKSNGICVIKEIQNKKFADAEREYYVLESFPDARSVWYVPVDSPDLVASMNRLLSAEEIEALLDLSAGADEIWDESYKKRADLFGSVIRSGKREDIYAVFKTLSIRRIEAENSRRKLYVSDERALHSAEKIITDEISFVLKMPKSDVAPYVLGRLGIK